MEYYSAVKRNKTESFVETWMNLESVTYSEVSQKEKKIMYQYIYVKSEKKKSVWTTLFTKQKEKHE